MSDIRGRLDELYDVAARMSGKIDQLVVKCLLRSGDDGMDEVQPNSGLETRLSRLVLLLFRSPLDEFKVLDEYISTTVPVAIVTQKKIKDEKEGKNTDQENADKGVVTCHGFG